MRTTTYANNVFSGDTPPTSGVANGIAVVHDVSLCWPTNVIVKVSSQLLPQADCLPLLAAARKENRSYDGGGDGVPTYF